MTPSLGFHRSTAWLAALCLGLGLLLVLAVVRAPFSDQHETLAASSSAPSAISPASLSPRLPPFDHFSQIAARTIFRADRRPPAKGTASDPRRPAPTVAAPMPSFVLLGIVITRDRRAALLQVPGHPKTVLVPAGEAVAGWTLAEVHEDKVTFSARGRRVDLAFPAHSATHAPPRQPGAPSSLK